MRAKYVCQYDRSERIRRGMSKKDDIYSKKRVVGHNDAKNRIRKKDGIIFPGEEIGYVDFQGQVRKPAGIISKGEIIGEVKDKQAKAIDGLIFKGEQYGYVDDEGNIRLKDGVFFRGRIIGQVKGNNTDASLAFFMLRFKKLEESYDSLKSEFESEPNKGKFLLPIQNMLESVHKAKALGDFDSLLRNLKELERRALDSLGENLGKKEALCLEAERLGDSTNWKAAGERMKELQELWKRTGHVSKEKDSELWDRFKRATNEFYDRRKKYFEEIDKERQTNLEKKKKLYLRVLELSDAGDWKRASDEVRGIQAKWKEIGPVPKTESEESWNNFKSALDQFYAARNAFYDSQRGEREQKKNHWLDRVSELINKKEQTIERLESSIEYDEEKIGEWQNKLWNLRPGGRSEQIRYDLEDRIDSVRDKIEDKRDKVNEIRQSIYELKEKLKKS